MRHPDGGFFSSQDADSEGEEGRFYVWSWDEIVEVAGEEVAEALGARPEGNWEGTNVLWRPGPEVPDDARRALFERREKRERPGTDDKILAGWNGLAIQALAETGRALGRSDYVEAAENAANFVLSALRRPDGRLLRAWRDGRTSGPAYLDDHALMASACLELYQTTFDTRWFEEARRLAGEILELFRDPDGGAFFQTGSDAEPLVIRPKELLDNAVPSGNSVAAEVLQRLAMLTGDADMEAAGVAALRPVRDLIVRAPSAFGHALSALDLYLAASKEIAIAGELEAAAPLLDEVWRRYLPNTVLAAASPSDQGAADSVPLLRDRPPIDGKPAAYVCERFVCRRPVTEPAELAAQLR
jgi:uncharacterized protein